MKRAQSALEYLTTYGWAILGILAIIGVMSYMGLSDPTNNVPTSCNLGTTFSCGAYIALENGEFAFEFKNLERTNIIVTDYRCEFPDGSIDDFVVDTSDPVTNLSVSESAVIHCNPSVAQSLSGKDLLKVRIQYEYDEPSPLPRVSTGEIVSSISEDAALINQYTTDPRLLPII